MAAPLPLILRNPASLLAPIPTNPPLRLPNTHSHIHSPLSTTKPFSVISLSSSSTTRPLFPILNSSKMEGSETTGNEITEEVTETTTEAASVNGLKKIFVAGATGSTGKRIVEQLLARGYGVKAGVRDLEKAKTSLPSNNPALEIVKADVTEGSAKLAEAISSDSEAVICATGFSYGWDVFAPWKAENYIRKSGINYTIIRPGGLRNEPPTGNLVMEPEDTLSGGTISRDLVAEVAIEALVTPEASYKVVEIVSSADSPKRTYEELFGSVKQR